MDVRDSVKTSCTPNNYDKSVERICGSGDWWGGVIVGGVTIFLISKGRKGSRFLKLKAFRLCVLCLCHHVYDDVWVVISYIPHIIKIPAAS